MQLGEFAESILFGETLEVKLAAPDGEITDSSPGQAIALPETPNRPLELRFADKPNAQNALPRSPELEDEQQRGALLHFFANHELLATELMALVLLKFPDAPAEFRQGVYETLREEQKHTLWYVRRMEECGVKFGDFPVSGFFWKCVAPMETPLDYVSRLSLTFEQANLDYSLHYAQVFRASGDEKSARILQSIYRDEISHVNYGLEWFRRWKAPGQTDWEAFAAQLEYPLSPSRAKANSGAAFNRKGRLAAGLDEGFVRELHAFERSKGRTPRVYWFCPDAENQMANGLEEGDYQAKKEVRALAEDLDLLPAFLSSQDDIVLVRRMPSLEHRERLLSWGFQLPEFELLSDDGQLEQESLAKARKLSELCPWAWCPQSARLLEPLRPNLPEGPSSASNPWNEKTRLLFSKVTDLDLASRFQAERNWEFLNPTSQGVIVTEVEALKEVVARVGAEVVLKAPFGASGQKNQRWRGEPTAKWAAGIIQQQGAVVVEPWLDRVLDFSVQYQMEAEGLRLLGFVRLINDSRGQFRAVQCGPKIWDGVDPGIVRFLHEGSLAIYDNELRGTLECHLRHHGYLGPVGIDAMVYRSESRELKLKPLVEINPRYTMGSVVWELRRRVASGRSVRFSLQRSKDATNEVPASHKPDSKLESGRVILNEPLNGLQAILEVAKRQTDFA